MPGRHGSGKPSEAAEELGGGTYDPRNVYDVIAALLREPFNLSPADLHPEGIGKLTPWQIKHLVFRQESRQTQGEVQPFWELFRNHWRRHGLSEVQIRERWIAEGHGK